jgi:DNA polymerase-4
MVPEMADAPILTAFCRDCLSPVGPGVRRCVRCGSPRIAANPEAACLAIAHVDCDAFFAAIEKRDNPDLADKPVIIGGGKRGVVSTACYVARTYGIRSAMPMFKALRACPHAVVIKPDIEKYARVGRQVRERMRALTPLVEPLSIDEAFLDLSGTERVHKAPPALTLARFAREVEREIGITVSVGLSYNKFLAKIASDFDKPRGFSMIGRAEALDFLAGKPVGIFHGVGKAAQERLARHGIRTVADIRPVPLPVLVGWLGKEGERLHRLAHGQDERRVNPDRETKGVSAETTFDEDIAALDRLEPILWRMAEKLSARLKAADFATRSITLKLKTADFKTLTRSRSGLPPTQLSGRLYQAAHDLLAPACDGTAYRLIGIGTGDLCAGDLADRGDLADFSVVREAQAERAVDQLRDKFGKAAVLRGIALREPPRRR